MAQSVSSRIYEALFAGLAELEQVSAETIEALRRLHEAGQLDSRPRISRFVRDMEQRHAQSSESND